MVFSELRFFPFLAAVMAVYWLLQSNNSRKIWLLLASYVFYCVWDWRFAVLLLMSTLFNYWFGLAIYRATGDNRRKRLLQINVITNLVVLGVFKYYHFFADSLVAAAERFGFHVTSPTLDIILPIGISFYTFQVISYTVDIYRGQLEPAKGLVDFALFISFFPHCVAGPIVRARDFLPQLEAPKQWHDIDVRRYLALFLVGFVKKACISDNVSPYVDSCFGNAADYSAGSIQLAVVLYAVQIYCDFSGYTDMAIASAGLFGYRLCTNFDAPYLAVGVSEFWRRWHISLSSWLRDYLYIPLGGNRHGRVRTSVNLMLTMLLGGLWHGASWNFVIWGALHGLALVFSQVVGAMFSTPRSSVVWRISVWAATMWWVCLAWILFRASDLSTVQIMARAWSFGGSSGSITLPSTLWVYICALGAIHILWRRLRPLERLGDIRMPVFSAGLGVTLSCALAVANNSSRPFIYFQF